MFYRVSTIGIFVAALWIAVFATAHDVITTKLTYSRDVSRILAVRCLSCHGQGSAIPLTTYEETRPWAVAIKEQVLSRSMPPWGAVKGFGHLVPDNALTQEEIMIIAAWVIGGAPNGDPALLPKPESMSKRTPKLPALKEALTIETKTRLAAPVALAALAPLTETSITDAKITATLPSGEIEPLLWLHNYQPAWGATFRMAEPVALPAGTVIEASVPLRFQLKTL